ncbi:hypothetical protein IMSAGC009_03746 [Lachnospiraceae bacterium]|jgi:putative aldouronate transport system substrate-binding protein|nr:hypothetical protein IMSAGC009_03746 [Lachnospiraceae bacterium]
MFSKKKRVMSLLLAVMLLTVGLCACGSKGTNTGETAQPADTKTESASEEQKESQAPEAEAAGPDISQEVTLVMYLIGDRPVDNDEVFAKINERLKAEINATIDVKFMSWSEYEQKYPLIFASGEDWDIIYTADWCFYNAQASKQGFYEITQEALETYAPMTAETMYPEAWEQAKVNDKVYMLPMNYKEITAYVYMARGDLMDKYGISSVSTLDEAESYMDAIVKNEPSLIPIDVGSDYDKLFLYDRMYKKANWESEEKVIAIGPWQVMASVSEVDDEVKVMGSYDYPAFKDTIERLKDWKDRGFWSKNAVVNTQNNTESFQAGKSALAMMNVNTAKSVYASVSAEHPEWDIRVFDAQDGVPPVLNSYLANGMSIFSKSKNPERALMALDYLRNDEEINSLFCYGIEGKHWEAAGEGALVSLPDSANYAYDSNCNWGVRNDAYWRVIEGGIPNLADMNKEWQETARSDRYQTFVFNDESVKNEIAAMGEIFDTDYKLLGLGFTDDPEADIAKLREKMEAAGAQKVYDEIQKQGLEFLAAN